MSEPRVVYRPPEGDGVAELALNRPAKRNALDDSTIAELDRWLR